MFLRNKHLDLRITLYFGTCVSGVNQITLQDIQDFENTYKGSDEERKDLLRLYRDCSGDMDCILDSALCSGPDNELRITDILQVNTGDRSLHGDFKSLCGGS